MYEQMNKGEDNGHRNAIKMGEKIGFQLRKFYRVKIQYIINELVLKFQKTKKN